MEFIVEFRLNPGSKNKLVDVFELRGPNRNPGVSFRRAWIATRSDLAFVLVECDDESQVAKACHFWDDYGTHQIIPVVDVESF